MRLGIVGSEAAKFIPLTEERARIVIRKYINQYATEVVSGGCHLGGIDIWAVEEAKKVDVPIVEFLPKTRNWQGYKERNIRIAERSELIICITLSCLPPGYKQKGFEKYCYHCMTDTHVKSGGCWTVKFAKRLGKTGYTLVIEGNNDSPHH